MPTFILNNSDDIFPLTPGFPDNSGNDTISALDGNDIVDGGDGNDLIDAGLGNDDVDGGDGDDTIDGGPLSLDDVLDGGTGDDLAVLAYDGVQNVATGRDVRIVLEFAPITHSVLIDGIVGTTMSNFERISISSGNSSDRISGGSGNDTISTHGGSDRVSGGGGNDRISKTWGTYALDGGKGQDTLTVSGLDNGSGIGLYFIAETGFISAGQGLRATSGGFSRFEHFIVTGTGVSDDITLGSRDDSASGGGGNDQLRGGGGNDLLDGGAGNDNVSGGAGDDTLNGGSLSAGGLQAADTLLGGSGNDLLSIATPGFGATLQYTGSVFDGGNGHDRLELMDSVMIADLSGASVRGIEEIVYSATNSGGLILGSAALNGVQLLDAGAGRVTLADNGAVTLAAQLTLTQIFMADGGQRFDLSQATRAFGDFLATIWDGTGNDSISGSGLRDRIYGRGGDDGIDAGAGDDSLTGGVGLDTLTGGGGADLFVFIAAADSGSTEATAEVITDFTLNPATGAGFVDRIYVNDIDARAGTPGNDNFTFIGTAAFSGEGQVRVRQSGADTIVELNTTGAGGAEMMIRLVGVTDTQVEAADFVL